MDLYDEIYYSLTGQMAKGAALDWVPNAFGEGSVCYDAYQRLTEARNRVEARLGVDDDEDLEQMLGEMETIQRCLCRAVMELRCL